MLVDFCLPAKNEEKLLRANVGRLFSFLEALGLDFDWRIVILLNGCTDESARIAQDLFEERGGRIIFYNYREAGKAQALKRYFAVSPAQVLVFMDVDLAVSLENLPNLLKPILENKADLVFGSRLLIDSEISRSWWRELVSRSYNNLSRFLLGHDFKDLQCGFKAFKKEVFEKISPCLLDKQWFFDTELIIFSLYFGFRIQEIPVNWQENRYQKRKSRIRLFKDTGIFIKNLLNLKKRLLLLKARHGNVSK